MQQTGYAYFVMRPRILEDLIAPRPEEIRQAFEVVKVVKLNSIDYENFVTDMVADRQFIEDYAEICAKGDVWKCLLVQKRGRNDGVLVMPDSGCFVGFAAYWDKSENNL